MHDIQAPAKPSLFRLVSDMNTAFSNPRGDPHNIDWVRLRRQVTNIAGEHRGDEYKELLDAIDEKSVYRTRDALADILVFTLGAFHFMGYDADVDTAEVVRAVMTRFCRDPAHLAATIEWYAGRGVSDVYYEGEFPRVALKARTEQRNLITGERISAGKFLKALGYAEPNFLPLAAP